MFRHGRLKNGVGFASIDISDGISKVVPVLN
jgi:hypothetical protein